MEIRTFIPTDHFLKCLIYGPSGSGKTVFTGTAEEAIYASAEGGLLSIADKNPQFAEIKSLKDLADLYSYLTKEKHGYETIVIDSITEINEIIKAEIEKKTGHTMQLQDWGTLAAKIRKLFRDFRDLPMNVILIAQESYITDEDKIKKVVPSLNGKAATEIAYFMDVVGYIHLEPDGSRWIETSSNRKLLTKDRTNVISNDAKMDFSEWLKFASKIKTGKQKVEATHVQAPTQAASPSGSKKHLRALQEELMARGAKNKEEALNLLNNLLVKFGSDIIFGTLDLSEQDASSILIKLLQIPKTQAKEETKVHKELSKEVTKPTPRPKKKKEVESTEASSLPTDFASLKRIAIKLKMKLEIDGFLDELKILLKNGEITLATHDKITLEAQTSLKKLKKSTKK